MTYNRRYWARYDDEEERGAILLRYQKQLDLAPGPSDWMEVDVSQLNDFEIELLSRGGDLVVDDRHPIYHDIADLLDLGISLK